MRTKSTYRVFSLNFNILNKNKLPGGIDFMAQLPKDPIGKIVRKVLKRAVLDLGIIYHFCAIYYNYIYLKIKVLFF